MAVQNQQVAGFVSQLAAAKEHFENGIEQLKNETKKDLEAEVERVNGKFGEHEERLQSLSQQDDDIKESLVKAD
jgi:hypothetical protein